MVQYFFAVLETLKNREDEGQGLVEYALIVALISVVAIAALTAIGGGVNSTLNTVVGSL